MGLALGRQIYKLQQIRVNEPDSQSHQQQKGTVKHKGRFNLIFQTEKGKERVPAKEKDIRNAISLSVLSPKANAWIPVLPIAWEVTAEGELRLVQVSGAGASLLPEEDNQSKKQAWAKCSLLSCSLGWL